MERLEEIAVKLSKIEKTNPEGLLLVTFQSDMGKYGMILPKDSPDLKKFDFAKKYIAIMKVSGMPDFIGDADIEENICTVSYKIEQILDQDKNLIYDNHIPYSTFVPNAKTRKAMDEVDKGIGLSKAYDDVDELMRDLQSDDPMPTE